MSMTREEAIAEIERLLECAKKLEGPQTFVEFRPVPALEMALSALRPVSREQVEKVWRGEWKCHGDCGVTECSACGWNIEEYVGDYNFCPVCGAAQTDKAVQMVMKRMEEMRNG